MIKTEKTKGYTKLTEEQKKMFTDFLENFKKAWGLEARETIQPISIEEINKDGRIYLKFVYKMYGRKEWLQVLDPNTWY